MEDPFHLAGARVEAAHVPGIGLAAGEAGVLDDAADDDRVAGDGQGLRVREAGTVDRAAQRGAQVDGAVRAEVGVLLAGAGVERDEQQVVGGDEDAGVVARAVLPVGDAAVLPAHVGGPVQSIVGLRVVRPDELAGARVERRDLSERGAQVDHAVDHQRHRLERTGSDVLPFAGDLGLDGPPAPGDLQVVEVLRRDLIQRRVLRVGGVVSEVAPLGVGTRLSCRESRHGQREEREQQGRSGRAETQPSALSHRSPPVCRIRAGGSICPRRAADHTLWGPAVSRDLQPRECETSRRKRVW